MSNKNRIDKASSALKIGISKTASVEGSAKLRGNSTQQGPSPFPSGKSNKKK